MKAKTYALDDIIVVVMRGSRLYPAGADDYGQRRARPGSRLREDFQGVMAQRYRDTIKELTGRTVVAFISQADVEPDITVEMFFVDGALPGFGAVEITQTE
jgi:hypothetical protein